MFEQLLDSIAKKQFAPIFLLHGEEAYYIDRLEAALEKHALSEAEKSFNQTIFYGKDADAMTMLDTLRRYPMMAERQVVILREAQDMKGLGDLAAYAEKPVPTTIFVICHKYKKLDERIKLAKSLKAGKATIFESKKLYDNQIPDFISGFLSAKKLKIDSQTAALIAEHLGTDLSKIANELEKLGLNLPPGMTVSAKHVEEFIGISKDYNIFELQKALAMRDVKQATKIARNFAENSKKNPLVMTISGIYNYFSKVWLLHFLGNQPDGVLAKALDLRFEFFLKEYKMAAKNYPPAKAAAIIGILKDYDLRSKGVGSTAPEEELLKEMVWKILH